MEEPFQGLHLRGGHKLPKTLDDLIAISEQESHEIDFGGEMYRLPKQIRKFQDRDYERLKELMNSYLSKFYDGHDNKNPLLDQLINRENYDDKGFFTKNKFVLIFEDEEGNPIGLVAINNKRGPSVKTGPLLVDEKGQGLGVGKVLKLCTELIARRMGKNKIYATTSALNEKARGLNAALGFKEEVYYEDQYKKGSPEVVLGKMIVPESISEEERNKIKKNIKSAVLDSNCLSVDISNANEDDRGYLEEVRQIYAQWHDDLGTDFTDGMLNGHNRGMNFQEKGKNIFIARDSDDGQSYEGIGILTPKRGGPCKLYPIAGSELAQKTIIESAEKMCKEIGGTKLYTFVQEFDTRELELLLSQGFRIAKSDELGISGVIQSPYKVGYNLIALEKMFTQSGQG